MGLFGNLLSSSSKTSSPTTTTVNNNQVAVSGSGVAFGAQTYTAGPKSTIAGGNVSTFAAPKIKAGKGATVNYSPNFITPDSSADLAQFAQTSAAQNVGLIANFQSLLSQGLAALTPASAPAPVVFDGGGAIPAATSAGDSQVVTDSGNGAPPKGISAIEWLAIIGVGIGAVSLFLHAKKQ